MFEYQFSDPGFSYTDKFSLKGEGLFMPVVWGEHCMECSAPECYATCNRYVGRSDGHCRRFKEGIKPVWREGRLMAEVHFKDWGKLEAELIDQYADARSYEMLFRKSMKMGRFCACMSGWMPSFYLKSKWFGLWTKTDGFNRSRCCLQRHEGASRLVGRIINEAQSSAVFLDLKSRNKDTLSRQIIQLPTGDTVIDIELDRLSEASHISIHPVDAEAELRLIFDSLDIVPCVPKGSKPKKVKCVIWDLDNTLWKGVLIESERVEPRQEFVDLIRSLDRRGIVNSIASKNDESQAMARLEELGIADLFVFKKINWNPKSQNILNTVREMNINPDTVVFVDDNPFEREEVQSQAPTVVCIDPADILEYASGERFDVPVSEESSKRRETYKMLEALKREQQAWTGNIDDFLITCQIKLSLSTPTAQNIDRCYELLQRTNQLNSSGRRLTKAEVEQIVASDASDTYVLESSDKFGSYGIVGFMIVDKRESVPTISDFVISCRVANKKIEPTVINYLAAKYGGEVCFRFKQTKLNGPMKSVIDELSMQQISSEGEVTVYGHRQIGFPKIVELNDLTR